MLSLKKMVSHGEEIVGWYATTPVGDEDGDVDFMTAYIHDHYSQTYLGADTPHLVEHARAGDRVNANERRSPLTPGADTLAAQFHNVRVDDGELHRKLRAI